MAPLDTLQFYISTNTNDGILKYDMLTGASQGNDDILFYDVSNPNNTLCLTANQTLGNVSYCYRRTILQTVTLKANQLSTGGLASD